MALFLCCTSTGRVVLCYFLWFYVQELPKAQAAVVLVLKRLRRRSNGLKSHPIDWEKPGIEPATPGLQDIGLSPTPFCGFPGYKPVPLGWFKINVGFITGTPKGSPKVVFLWRSRESNLRPLVYKAERLSPTPLFFAFPLLLYFFFFFLYFFLLFFCHFLFFLNFLWLFHG